MIAVTEREVDRAKPITFAQPQVGLVDFLKPFLLVLWKEWQKGMELAEVSERGFALRGICPHCDSKSVFLPVTKTYIEEDERGVPHRLVGALRCVGCGEYILGILRMQQDFFSEGRATSVYDSHYPLGKPDDSISNDVPEAIREELREALHCRWVEAHKAVVLMCRRALQVSCDLEKAAGKDLYSQVDDLAKSGKITETLRKMAQRIRLLGGRGAHGDFSDINKSITAQDADDAIVFMRHYLEHVYELPARLNPPQP